MNFVLVVLSIVVAADVLWWFAVDRLASRLPKPRPWRRGVAVFMLLTVAAMAWVIVGRGWDAPVPAAVVGLVLMWHLIVLPAALGLTLMWMPIERLATGKRYRQPDPARRALLASLVAAPPAVALVGTGVGLARGSSFRVRRLDVTLPTLPAALDGLRLVHLSDSHVGTFTHGRVLRDISDAVNQLDADLLLFTGDLINHDHDDIPAGCDLLNACRAKHGVYAIEGNHDLFEGRDAFRRKVEARGVDLLVNDTRRLTIHDQAIDLMGLRWGGPAAFRQDRTASRSDDALSASLDELLQHQPLRPDALPILLAHHPHAFDAAADRGLPLTLTGHTHGGQLMLPGGVGFGPAMFRYWSGLYQRLDGHATVVSNGVGNWFPLRTFAPAEIVEVTLRAAVGGAGEEV